MTQATNVIAGSVQEYDDTGKKFAVQGRGRPERHPVDAARRALRRQKFGLELRGLRVSAGLTLLDAAKASGLSSARKLAQYETTCYPPGDVICALSKVYGVSRSELGWKLLRHSDPDLYMAVKGERGYEPTELEIEQFRQQIAKKGDRDALGA